MHTQTHTELEINSTRSNTPPTHTHTHLKINSPDLDLKASHSQRLLINHRQKRNRL